MMTVMITIIVASSASPVPAIIRDDDDRDDCDDKDEGCDDKYHRSALGIISAG